MFFQVLVQLFQIVGSLVVFLYGMRIMSESIQRLAGDKLQNIVNKITSNRFMAVLIGVAITALIQSSSATTVMVVSFANAALLNLSQAAGVIMGANIGTTITAWIVSQFGFKLQIAAIAIPIMAIALPFMFSKSSKKNDFGLFLIGFGLLFLGLDFLKDSMSFIKENTDFLNGLANYTNLGFLSFIIFVAVGTILTILVQSSSAAMTITLTLVSLGVIDFRIAAFIVLGENIGTTITAYLASIGANVNARRAARFHTLFNLIGVAWMAICYPWFLDLVRILIPNGAHPAEAALFQLSTFHTLFNITNTLLLIWFIPQLTKVVINLVKERPQDSEKIYSLPYISTTIQDTAEINIINAKKEISKMADVVLDMYNTYLKVFENRDNKMGPEVKKVKSQEELTDIMEVEISQYLSCLAQESLNKESASNVNSMIRIVTELESIGDSCYNLMLLLQRRYDKKIKISAEGVREITSLSKLVEDYIHYIKGHLNEHLSKAELEEAYRIEKSIDETRDKIKKSARKRLQAGANVKTILLVLDIIKHLEHIGDFSLNIAQALRRFL
ncbi:MAG: Na/Pi cotransporter family protein [Spirochaetales bacterium]|nr:Na/Pi cotransporter family protein [Spirochaetales bacterium]